MNVITPVCSVFTKWLPGDATVVQVLFYTVFVTLLVRVLRRVSDESDGIYPYGSRVRSSKV